MIDNPPVNSSSADDVLAIAMEVAPLKEPR